VRSSAFAKNSVDKAHLGPEGVFDQYGYKISLAHLLNWLRSSGCKVWLGRVRSLIEQLENRQKFPSGELTQGEEEEREKKQSAAAGTKQVTPTTLTLRPAAAASAAAATDREEEGERKRKKKRKDTSDTE
jgi:hypothetical protein